MKAFIFIVTISCCFFYRKIPAQTYFVHEGYSAAQGKLHKHIFNSLDCSQSNCSMTYLGIGNSEYEWGMTMTPDADLIILGEFGLSEVDTLTGTVSWFFGVPPWPNWPWLNGLVTIDGVRFYTLSVETPFFPEVDSLYELNINTGVITDIGKTNYRASHGDMTLFGGEIYYITRLSTSSFQFGVVRLNLNDPANSELVTVLPDGVAPHGLSATRYCNTLIAFKNVAVSDELILINLIDGAIIEICEPTISDNFNMLTSMEEFSIPSICDVSIDLDCDDSSGATESDYNSSEFTCLSLPVLVSDNDLFMTYDALIEEMTVQLIAPLPDDPFEILNSTGSVPNISVDGSGTDLITLTNDGEARSTDFMAALRLIIYDNIAILPTAGLRTVEVQFTTESGSMSNVATAFIQVNELPLVEIDLGSDIELCEGESATFDAGNPGADYIWSNGTISQTITVDDEGQYIVTVSDGVNCPNQDTVALTLLPVVHVALEGQFQTCDNIPLTLTINTDSPFPITVEISATPGSPFVLNNVIGSFTFNDLPTQETEYTITSVTPSQPACIEITDPTQLVDVYPSYIHLFDANICDGDSIWLGFYWETEPGVYENTFNTFEGCDSVVTTTVNVLPAINISIQSNTCDSSEAGVFIQYLNNPTGCDTVITTTVSLLLSDTTLLIQSSCRQSETGVFTLILSNQQGCDSIVITNVTWSPPADTTFISQTSCDSSQLGITQEFLTAIDGCDSLVVTSVTYVSVDTTYSFATSCDNSQIGVTQQLYSDPQGCDSLVITTVTAAIPDTTYAFATSCDSSSLGVFEMHFIDQNGCDSVVFTTVTFSASDSTFLQSTSCDPSETGIFVYAFINQFGCDSIVTTSITLLPSNEIFIQTTTCDENQAGVFTDSLTNSYGCDSIIITTIGLLPSDQTSLSATTCRSSEAGVFINNLTNQSGCDSIVTLTVSLIAADTTVLTNKTCIQEEVGSIETTYTNQDGCDSLVIEQTILHDLPELQFTTSDYNGYGISCKGETDGSIDLQVSGTSPFEYIWSTHATTQSLTELSAGAYAVTVTDANGCNTSTEIILFEPEAFSIGFEITHPDCFDANAGSITVQQTGGIEPVRYSIDGINYQLSPVFENLNGGMYEITAIDANECETQEILLINVPLMVSVNLGEDMQFFPGDTAVINAIVNVPYDSLASVQWSGLNNTNCPTCLSQTVTPIITTTYSVTVTTHDGCADEDALTLFVENDNDVYVPNIFSPDGDGVNDELIISTGNGIEKVISFIIYDRWGNVVFEKNNMQASEIKWDGRFKNHYMNPGVYAFRLIVEHTDDNQEVSHGDITVIR